MLTVKVDGVWLRFIGPYGSLTFSHTWPHGSEQATWKMLENTRHPALRGGASVEIWAGGTRIWLGKLSQPGLTGDYTAKGLWAEAEGVLALDAGVASNVPDDVIDDAISRDAVSWSRPASLSSVAWGTADQALGLSDLLDQAMTSLGKRWWVDADGAVRAAADPTTPTLVVPYAVAGHGLTLAEDDYYSHLIGQYLDLSSLPAVTDPIGDAAAADKWGYKEAFVDLAAMGPIDEPTAEAEVTARLALAGARMGFSESLNLGFGQMTTIGGISVSLTSARAISRAGGAMARLAGVRDQTRPLSSPNTDIVLTRSSYTEGSQTVQLDPMGKATRNMSELLKVAAAAAAA